MNKIFGNSTKSSSSPNISQLLSGDAIYAPYEPQKPFDYTNTVKECNNLRVCMRFATRELTSVAIFADLHSRVNDSGHNNYRTDRLMRDMQDLQLPTHYIEDYFHSGGKRYIDQVFALNQTFVQEHNLQSENIDLLPYLTGSLFSTQHETEIFGAQTVRSAQLAFLETFDPITFLNDVQTIVLQEATVSLSNCFRSRMKAENGVGQGQHTMKVITTRAAHSLLPHMRKFVRLLFRNGLICAFDPKDYRADGEPIQAHAALLKFARKITSTLLRLKSIFFGPDEDVIVVCSTLPSICNALALYRTVSRQEQIFAKQFSHLQTALQLFLDNATARHVLLHPKSSKDAIVSASPFMKVLKKYLAEHRAFSEVASWVLPEYANALKVRHTRLLLSVDKIPSNQEEWSSLFDAQKTAPAAPTATQTPAAPHTAKPAAAATTTTTTTTTTTPPQPTAVIPTQQQPPSPPAAAIAAKPTTSPPAAATAAKPTPPPPAAATAAKPTTSTPPALLPTQQPSQTTLSTLPTTPQQLSSKEQSAKDPPFNAASPSPHLPYARTAPYMTSHERHVMKKAAAAEHKAREELEKNQHSVHE